MGTSWSTSTSRPEDGGAAPLPTNLPSDQATQSSVNRKRRRSRSDSINDDDDDSSEGCSPSKKRGRKRRRTGRFPDLSRAWDAFADTLSCYFAKLFLYVAELAAKSGANPSELAEEPDLLRGLMQSLDCFQSSNLDILRRGWRLLCVCSKECDRLAVHGLLDETSTAESDARAVLTAMERHARNIRIQLLGFRALRTLVVKSDEQWDVLIKAEAVPVFVEAMRIYHNDVVVQGLASTFLAILVREVGEKARQQVVVSGGIELILRAMRNFEDDPRLLHTGCYALHQLGLKDRQRDILLANGALDILFCSADRHLDDSNLLELCFSALSKLTDTNNLGGRPLVPLILRAMRRWPDEASIQGHALALLLSAVNQEPAPVDVAVCQIVRAMKRFPDSPSLQFFACATLREMMERFHISDVKNIIYRECAVECIVSAVLKHRGAFGLQPMALLVLMNIWEQRTPFERVVSAAFGGNEHVIAAITGMRVEMDQNLDVE